MPLPRNVDVSLHFLAPPPSLPPNPTATDVAQTEDHADAAATISSLSRQTQGDTAAICEKKQQSIEFHLGSS